MTFPVPTSGDDLTMQSHRSSARTHLYAWYTYSFAAEVFSACAIAIFLPITLEQMAREVGFVAPELSVPCSQMDRSQRGEDWVCKARILGSWVDTASFSMYVKSIAVAIQALAIMSVGPLADSPRWRKKLLLLSACAGSLSGIAFFLLPSTPATWIPVAGAGLTIVGGMAYATTMVCSNAFLPGLAREDPKVIAAERRARNAGNVLPDEGQEGDVGMGARGLDEDVDGDRLVGNGQGEDQRLLPHALDSAINTASPAALAGRDLGDSVDSNSDEARYQTLLSLTMSRISSVGTGLGFFSGVSVLALLTLPVTLGHGSTASMRLAIGLSAVWWAVFTIPPAYGLPSGKESDDTAHEDGRGEFFLRTAWNRVARMVAPRQIKRLPNLFTLLFAWIFLSDGFHTTTSTAILYASTTLRMGPTKVIITGVLVQLAAVVSLMYTPRIQRKLGHTNMAVLLRIVILGTIIPIYTCIGLILPFGGLRTEGEMYVAATWFGLIYQAGIRFQPDTQLYGPFNSYSRAVYAELLPPGHESSFFSLFALTDKSASFVGPFVVGIIADTTGNIRLGFLFLLVMLVVPVPVLLKVDVPRGREEAKLWTRHG